jgi:hypothetical protein
LSSSEAEFVIASQAGQDAVYLRVLLKGFGYIRYRNIWRFAPCILMSENLTKRDRSRHVDSVEVFFLRDLVRDGHVKLVKCAGTQNVSDALTKSLIRAAIKNHGGEYMWGHVPSCTCGNTCVFFCFLCHCHTKTVSSIEWGCSILAVTWLRHDSNI